MAARCQSARSLFRASALRSSAVHCSTGFRLVSALGREANGVRSFVRHQSSRPDGQKQGELRHEKAAFSVTPDSKWHGTTIIGGIALVALSALMLSTATPVQSEETADVSDTWKKEVTLLCLVGPTGSGKTTQANRLAKRWPEFSILSEIPSSPKLQKGKRYILDGYPRSAEEAGKIEKEVLGNGKIFCLLYFDLPLDDYIKRHKPDEQQKKAFVEEQKRLEPLIKRFRDQGNICEISADWESADEVWEQVEAKTEQIIQLRDMGEL